MAKFKCLLSGNVIEFTNKVDIDSMEGHEGYVLVEESYEPKPVVKQGKKQATKTTATTEVE